ncbi:DUF1508 domain-containing protein [Sphingomonas faeni]|uniref:DUF1508 domain-containing protein n=1 Tax=Sphingomonas faeni TaxID=185950 RepID=UPI00334EF6D3
MPQLPVLAGAWVWLLFHDDGRLISYSDGYATRAACLAAVRRSAWPSDLIDNAAAAEDRRIP